jgi:hypothetical protein
MRASAADPRKKSHVGFAWLLAAERDMMRAHIRS